MTFRLPIFSRHRLKADAGHGALMTKAGHADLVIKADGDSGIIEGYGSVFDMVDSYNERVKKGAFKKSLQAWKKSKKPIPMLWQHRSDSPTGVWTEYEEDDKGLFLRGQLNLEKQLGREVLSDVKTQAVTGLSIGYYEIVTSSWERPGNEPRDLIELDLRETSVVTFPALREAQIDAVKARLARGERVTEREFEAVMREHLKLSRAEAEFVNRAGYKAFLARDASGVVVEDDSITELSKACAELKLPAFEL